MPCYHPLQAWRSNKFKTENGKPLIVFDKKQIQNGTFEELKLPCGQCIGCRLKKAADWAVRCLHESEEYATNCFITLTYNEKYLPTDGSIARGKDAPITLFMKRLRKAYCGFSKVDDSVNKYPIRYFACGEYGEACFNCQLSERYCTCPEYIPSLGRPHYHILLFNFGFEDIQLFKEEDGIRLYTSEMLQKLWSDPKTKEPLGFCTVAELNWKTAGYVARYATKKITGEMGATHYLKRDQETGEPGYVLDEFVTMSRRPGIGKRFLDRYKADCYPKDFITVNGKKFPIPPYYDRLCEMIEPSLIQQLKIKRRKRACEKPEETHGTRLKTKEFIKKVQTKTLKRNRTNETHDLQCI